ncbi:28S ribosomal protein S35, mitochondrial [Galendromus occidentalis]|uniref:28S ribosomal protein S35, mitochondrial n=1 Tax=Galendromus occidentalis TaxID=34638 RepID=A0AAJ6VY62_9ACAR|nr:28S ribosomal protein S35, mitochondrial [Galendromus occidentalis]
MALLLRRSLFPQRFALCRVLSTDAPAMDEEFRTIDLYQRNTEERKMTRTNRTRQIRQKRADRMPVDQHWPSVWPVAASFKPSVVPLPVRQGVARKTSPPVAKEGNLELMKIPNFLHLTPPAIEAHCEALKKFCTKWPEALTDRRSKNWLTITTSDYLNAGPSIRDERARIVTLKLRLKALELDKHSREKLITILGERYNAKKDELVIVTDRCPLRRQNLEYSLFALTAAYHESWITEEWELTDRQEADMFEFTWEDSRSEKYAKEYASQAKNVSEKVIEEYGGALKQLKDQGDNIYNLDAYKKAVLALMNLKTPQSQTTVQ